MFFFAILVATILVKSVVLCADVDREAFSDVERLTNSLEHVIFSIFCEEIPNFVRKR